MKFILTGELGRLATWLRILGFDTLVEKEKAKVVMESLREKRVILTRDSKMSRFTGTRMVNIKSDFVEEQIAQVLKELDLKIDRSQLFKICVLCNERLEETPKQGVEAVVPEYVFRTQDIFLRCPKCDKVYWQGTHWALVNKFLEKISPQSTDHSP